MITVLPVKEEAKLKALFEKAAQPMAVYSGAVEAVDTATDEVLGFCLFDIDDKITIGAIEPQGDDAMLADGLLRSALHVGVTRGIGQAFYNQFAPVELLKQLGFIADETERALKIEKLTACGC